MLRSYAAAGLLVPVAVDPWSGYRYYAPGQLPEARLILLLRQAGVPLSEIAAFLRNPGPDQLQRWEQALDLEVASRLALDTLKARFTAPPSAQALAEAAGEASRAARPARQPQRRKRQHRDVTPHQEAS